MVAGKVVTLSSDAGTPCVSDPGSLLVQRAVAAGIKVCALPGACAATTALSGSGFDASGGFTFFGFVEGRGASAKRAAALAAVAAEPRPCILYESPRRVESTVSVLSQIDGSRGVVIGRELTKTHEELWRGTLFEATQWLAAGGGAGRELFTAGVDGAGPRGDSPRRKRTTRGARDDAPSQDRARALSGP